MDQALDIRRLKAEGLRPGAIARRLGISRNTARKYYRQETLLVRPATHPSPSKLDPYKDQIRQRLREFPELEGKRILPDLRSQGYAGSYSTLLRYLATVRVDPAVTAVIRFETEPGRQAQVDWAHMGTILVDGARLRLYAFIMILGYSRARYVEFTTRIDTATFLQCHLNAFAYFGGFPREVLYDNLKSVVLHRALRASESSWNQQYAHFANHFGFVPRLCHPYRPQTKGKVESSVKYVRRGFFLGRSFEGLQDLNRQAHLWCNTINQESHRTTGVPPIQRFAEENLTRLEDRPPYFIVVSYARRISRECFVSLFSNRYSVPWKYAGRESVLRVRDGRLAIEVGGVVVAEHELRPGTGSVVRVKEHFEGLYARVRRRNEAVHQSSLSAYDPPAVEHRSLAVYDRVLDGPSGV